MTKIIDITPIQESFIIEKKIDLKILNELDKLDDFQGIRDYLNSDGRKLYSDNEYFYHFEFKGKFFGIGFQSSRFLIKEYYTNQFRRAKGETKIINFSEIENGN